MRKNYDNRFKSKVAIEAIKGEKTIAQIASEYEVHPNQVMQWKKKALESLPDVFAGKNEKAAPEKYPENELLKQIGQLKVENEFLAKKYEQWLGRRG
jgi:transposase-like protein